MNYEFSDKVTGLQPSAIREILKFTADPEVISLAAGNPAPEAFPVNAIKEITSKLLETNPVAALQYSITEGYTPLRESVKKRISAQGCFDPAADELIITSGAQQANELSCKVKLRLGTALGCIIWLLFRLAKLYLKININSTKKRTAEAKPDAGKA